MKITQPVRNNAKSAALKSSDKRSKINSEKKNKAGVRHGYNNHKHAYGTSKLEADFAREFLDKLGLKYIYEYEAKDIGRFYDFAITAYDDIPFIMETKHGIECIKQDGQNVPISFVIEIDGGYYHSDPRVVNEKKLNPMQRHNKRIDMLKDQWCGLHGYPLLRIWEYDIRKNPSKVIDQLYKYIGDGNKKRKINDSKKRPH